MEMDKQALSSSYEELDEEEDSVTVQTPIMDVASSQREPNSPKSLTSPSSNVVVMPMRPIASSFDGSLLTLGESDSPQIQPIPIYTTRAATMTNKIYGAKVVNTNSSVDESREYEGAWAYGLFACFRDVGLCVQATFVPCIPIAMLWSVLGQRKFKRGLMGTFGVSFLLVFPLITYLSFRTKRVHDEDGNKSSKDLLIVIQLLAGLMMAVIVLFFLLATVRLRTAIRLMYRIPGSVVKDICTSILFAPLGLMQMSAQVGIKGFSVSEPKNIVLSPTKTSRDQQSDTINV